MVSTYKPLYARVEAKMETLVKEYKTHYEAFKAEVTKHSNSKVSVPEVGRIISDEKIMMSQALRKIHEAMFVAQELTNKYNILWGIRMSEIWADIKTLYRASYNEFMESPDIKDIKTSAEKERQHSIKSAKIIDFYEEVREMEGSKELMASYIRSLVFDLGKYQHLIDSMDRIQSKELWTNTQASILSDFTNDPTEYTDQPNEFDTEEEL